MPFSKKAAICLNWRRACNKKGRLKPFQTACGLFSDDFQMAHLDFHRFIERIVVHLAGDAD